MHKTGFGQAYTHLYLILLHHTVLGQVLVQWRIVEPISSKLGIHMSQY